ncbi:MAG: hypothetical protein U1F57_11095 [bacterium]
MSKALFWDWLYRLFDSENGHSAARGAKAKKGEDPFDAIHREFLWLKSGQIREKSLALGEDALWERNAHLFFRQEFVNTLTEESIGGNAGAGHTAINAFYNPITGEIKHFGNFQEIKGGCWDEITGSTTVEGDFHCLFRINVQYTGKISDVVFEQKPLSPVAQQRLANLVGLQVMIPFTKIYQALRSEADPS